MAWQLRVEHPDHEPLVHLFDRTAELWLAYEGTIEHLEEDGFEAGGVEAVRYGEYWTQRLTRNFELVTIHVEHVVDGASA